MSMESIDSSRANPKSPFHQRYSLEGKIDVSKKKKRLICGVDRLSRPPNKKVIIRIFYQQEHYEWELQLFRNLRSKYVANLTDQWTLCQNEEFQAGFLVLDRGMGTLSDLSKQSKEYSICKSRDALLDVCSIFLFLHQSSYSCLHIKVCELSLMYHEFSKRIVLSIACTFYVLFPELASL